MNKRKHQHIVETIVNSPAKTQGNFRQTSQLVTQLLCQHLTIDGVSVWRYNHNLTEQHNVAQFSPRNNVYSLRDDDLSICPDYLHCLKANRFIDASDPLTDSRVSEIQPHWLDARRIDSTLDVAIRINGKLEGALCLERYKSLGAWHNSEIHLACQLADQLALTLATQQGYEQEEVLSLFQKAVEQSEHVTLLINLNSERIEYINPAHTRMTGIPREDIQGQSVQKLSFFQQYPQQAEFIYSNLRKGKPVSGEVPLTRKDGQDYYLKYHVEPFMTQRDNLYALVHCEDNTQPHMHQAELERLAWRCGLTGLYNRTHFKQVLEKTREGVLLLIDLIGFKRFNDTHGHEKGDSLLMEIGKRITQFAHQFNALETARVGSDEFAILLPINGANAIDVDLIDRLYVHLCQSFRLDLDHFEPKVAIAVVDIAQVAEIVSPMTGADIAVQHAKKHLNHPIQFFNSEMVLAFHQNTEIELDLHQAIRERQFELFYQPLRDLKTAKYVGAEALLRWNHPKKGLLYPGAFMDIAEQTGLIMDIGAWVLEQACKQLYAWQQQKVDMTMHVNVSAKQFFGGQLYEQVWQLLCRYRLKPKTLVLEITETELMDDVIHATSLCNELSELGVGLAIDDFGTGYSSMRYLKQFPIGKIKIDRSFISDVTTSHESREIVTAIIAMAKALKISLTAEGVETFEQERFLSDCHCHQAQGFLYSQALPSQAFSQLLCLDLLPLERVTEPA